MTRAELDAFLAPAFAVLREQVVDLVYAELHANTRATLELVADAMKRSFRQGGEKVAARGVVAPSVTTASAKVTRTRAPRSVARAGSSPAPDTVRGGGRLSPRSAVPEPAVAAEQGSTSPRRKPNSCRKCGAVGFTAATCGTTHNVSIVDAGERGSGYSAPHVTQQGADTPGQRESAAAGNVADPHRTPIGHRGAGPATSILSAIPKMPAPRVKLSPAELEAAKQRAADRRAADARRHAPPQQPRPPDEEPPVLPMPENPTLPTPRSSWGVDGDFVRELGAPIERRRGRPRRIELERAADRSTP